MGLFQQFFCHVIAHTDGADIREEIESTLRFMELERRYFRSEAADEFASFGKGLAHLLDAVLWSSQRRFCRFLGDHGGAGELLSLETCASEEKRPVLGHEPPYPIAGHGIGLADTVDEDKAVGDVRERGERWCIAGIGEARIDFIGEDGDMWVVAQDSEQLLELLARVDRARRVIGRAEDEQACTRGERCAELGRREAIIILKSRLDRYYLSLRELDHLAITDPSGLRDDDFVTGINGRLYGIEDRHFGPH